MEKYGVKELKELLAFVLSLGMAVDKSLANDGKITLLDAANLLDPAMKAPAAFAGLDIALLELQDLSDDEKKELQEFVQASFDIADDKLEAVVEGALGVAISVAKVLAMLKKSDA